MSTAGEPGWQPLVAGDPDRVAGYRIMARLGAGGMGRVYLARSPGGRPVALKVIRAELADDPDFAARFVREVAAARAVSGAFTAPVLDADPDGDPAWLATGYVAGIALGDAVERFGPLSLAAAGSLTAGIAEALIAVHAAGIVHRDLKPSNVMLAADGPKVIDFGIVRLVDGGSGRHTMTGVVIGSPGYFSPEQVEGGDIGPAADVFALGSVVTFALTGRGPFGSGEPLGVLYRVALGEPDLAGVPPSIRGLLRRCLDKAPARRPTPAEIIAELDDRGLDGAWQLPAGLPEAIVQRSALLLGPPPSAPPMIDRLPDRPESYQGEIYHPQPVGGSSAGVDLGTGQPLTPIEPIAPIEMAPVSSATAATADRMPSDLQPHAALADPALVDAAPPQARPIPPRPAQAPPTRPAQPVPQRQPPPQTPPQPPGATRHGRLRGVTAAAVALVVLAGVTVVVTRPWERAPSVAGAPSTAVPSASGPPAASVAPVPSYSVTATVPVDTGTFGGFSSVTVTPDGRLAYYTNDSNRVTVVDTAAAAVVATVEVDNSIPQGASQVAVTADGRFAYVTGFNPVSVLDTTTHKIVGTIPIKDGPVDVARSADGSRLYMTLLNSSGVPVVDTARNAVVSTYRVPNGTGGGIAVSSDGRSVYVGRGYDSAVAIVDTSTGGTKAKVPIPGYSADSIAVSPDGSRVYAAAYGSPPVVAVIDPVAATVVSSVQVGDLGTDIALSPDGAILYVASKELTVIDTASLAITATVPIPDGAAAVAVSPDGSRIHVSTPKGLTTVTVTR